jgi:hypothetical protein
MDRSARYASPPVRFAGNFVIVDEMRDGRPDLERMTMAKLFAFLGMTIGGWIGWWLGERVGFTTAFILSMVGTGFGMYWGHRLAREYS